MSKPTENNPPASWRQRLARLIERSDARIDEIADVTWRRFTRHMGFSQPRHIAAYRGYGNDSQVWVQGRLLADKPLDGPGDDDGWWDNLRATYQRWQSDEIAGATVKLTYAEHTAEVITDEEGYYRAAFPLSAQSPETDAVVAQHRTERRVISATHWLLLPDPRAQWMVISDMDDTVIHTGITDLTTAAQLTFLNNAKTRKPLAGVGELYQALAVATPSRAANPIFYVSNSAWNMYDLLRDFLDLNDLPQGPLLLRDLDLAHMVGGYENTHKRDRIEELLARIDLPAILIGDSGQHDAELYAAVAAAHPERIKAIYIRDVDPENHSHHDAKVDEFVSRTPARNIPFLRVKDSDAIAAHLTELGLLAPAEVDEVREDVARDKQRPTLVEPAPDQTAP